MTADLTILIYHRVLERPDPLLPEQMHAALFARQLAWLTRFFTVLAPGVAIRRLAEGSLPPRAACVTFDDGYADNAEVALPILRRFGLKAGFFISSGYLDGGRMWNDSIIDAVRAAPHGQLDLAGHGLESLGSMPLTSLAERRHAIALLLGKLKYVPFSQRQRIADILYLKLAGKLNDKRAAPMLSSAQLQTLHRAGMEIGAHTVSHPILSALSQQGARAEMANGKRHLETLLQAPVTLFAYPNGKRDQDYGQQHADIAASLGFVAALATDPGVVRPGCDLFHLPRFTPWRRGPLGFLWQLQHNRRRRAPPP